MLTLRINNETGVDIQSVMERYRKKGQLKANALFRGSDITYRLTVLPYNKENNHAKVA